MKGCYEPGFVFVFFLNSTNNFQGELGLQSKGKGRGSRQRVLDDGAHFLKYQHLRGTKDLRLIYSLPDLGGSRLLPPLQCGGHWMGKVCCRRWKGGSVAEGGWAREHKALSA